MPLPAYALLPAALVAAWLLYCGVAWVFPAALTPLWRLVLHTIYRVRFYGRGHVPAEGPALVVCNHVSYLDWMLLWAACPRPASFLLWAGYYRNPVLRFFLSYARRRTIRVDNRTARPHAVEGSLKAVAAALDAGRVVVIFPEGRLTRNGNMRPLGRGVERILKLVTKPVPVIPTCIDGMWGSVLSHRDGPIFWKRPRGWRRRVAVMFGTPLTVGREPESAEASANPTTTNTTQGLHPGLLAITPSGFKAPKGRQSIAQGVNPGSESVPALASADSGSRLTTPQLQLAVQETMAECSIRQSDTVPLAHQQFVRTAVKFRNVFRTCVIDHSTGAARVLTWGKTFVAAACVARYLRTRLGPEPNVGVWLPTSLGGALANVALAWLGKTAVNLNYTAGAGAVRSATQQAGLRVVVTSKRFLHRVPLDLPDDIPRVFLEDVLEAVTKWERVSTFLTALLLPAWVIERFVLGLHRHGRDAPLTIVFSSGSTGEPKGVVLTHRNIAANMDSSVNTIGFRDSDRLLATLPFFHSFGYSVCLWAPLMSGAGVIFYPDPRAAKEVGELARTHAATILLSTATFMRFYLRRCGPDDFRTLRIIICGAEKLPVKLQDEFRAKFGVLPLEGYGCTEVSPVASTNLHDVEVNGVRQVCNTRGTVGQPIFGVCIKAFDWETKTPLPPLAEGVLCVKGPNVMAGYLHQPEKTKAAVYDGWYNTGDQGFVEETGFVRITGRVSRFAKIGGEMVPLERLDEELHDLIGGGDRVLVVAAVPDEKRGERLVVLHLPDLSGKMGGLLDALGKRGLPNLWVPDVRDCYPVEALPTLGSGKLDLKRVGELAKELAGQGGPKAG